ncbi:MAG: DUF402 domain-containing protein [Lachnospiraceae bacterium]|jgi:predicted RNA-binding protein associated with RNAse of E/G family|nr:DUF402 domain-containing protein [Lachnospiraceae bacterium]
MDNCPKLYRKRLIPEECVELKDDVVLRCDGDVIVTAWKALHPKRELSRGYSCYYLKRGIKVSKFISADGKLMYWYCDIVDYDWDHENNSLLVTDLLADVIVYPDGRLKVVDLDELADAFDRGLIDAECIKRSLRNCSRLLEIIYSRQFPSLMRPIEELCDQ